MRKLIGAVVFGVLGLAVVLPAQADEGRKKSLVTGVAIGAVGGVAAGYIGSKLLGSDSSGSAGGSPATTDSTSPRPVHVSAPQEEESCRMGPVKLYTASGEYVKTERLRICQ